MINLKLSICIATYKRGKFIGETLDSILSQMPPDAELVVVDGASPDNTPEVMAQYLLRYPEIRYFREQENSGIDRDYDKAVGYARGEYCWLMTDDDLLRAGSVSRVLDSIDANPDLVVVNAEVKNADFSTVLDPSILKFSSDREYAKKDAEKFFSEVASYLSFIGGVVIKRHLWLERDRASYYGTLFVHVGIIFQQSSISRVKVIADPLIVIRYGNAMWTARGFEIWIVKWPELIWSFVDFSDKAKSVVCPRGGWNLFKKLVFYRATGAYSTKEYNEILCAKVFGLARFTSKFVAMVPVVLASFIACIYSVILGGRGARMVMYSLNSGQHKNAITRWAARSVGAC